MFQQRPLTCLFIAATLAIDVVLMTTGNGDLSPFALGMVLGQIAVLANWTVRGEMHRLARMSLLVITIGLLTYLIRVDDDPQRLWLTFYTIYTTCILLVTIASDYMRYRSDKKDLGKDSAKRWQVPLIEFFGWTTVVAIISFGARQMDFEFLGNLSVLLTIVSLIAVPVLTPFFIRHDLRDLRSFKALLLVLVMILAAVYLQREHGSGGWAIFIQTGYITLWMAVIGMDDVLARVKNVDKDLLNDETASTPKLFNPED